MERAETGLRDKILRVFFPQRPTVPNLMFHIHSDRTVQINQHLLLEEEMRQINSALSRAGICSSVNDLSRGFGVDEIDKIVFGRVSRFIDNYVQTRALVREGNYWPKVVASEDSGIYNALVMAEAISLEDALALVREESRAIAFARNASGGYVFVNPEIPLHTSLIQPYLGEFNSALAEITVNEPKIAVVGGDGNIITTGEGVKKGITRQTIAPSSEKAVRITLKQLGVSKPHEIGLDATEGDNRYLTIGAAAIGTAGALAILGVIVHKRRRKG